MIGEKQGKHREEEGSIKEIEKNTYGKTMEIIEKQLGNHREAVAGATGKRRSSPKEAVPRSGNLRCD